ncbi:MAG: PhnD/SsuA/transferrin family substrate-binding protein [Desulfobacteraceae bacterium]|nr:PhnD/SsuA/transferrin family substrate-binding protein [Desulfobacteraceae bacterium]
MGFFISMPGGLTYIKAREAAGVIPIVAALGRDGKPFCRGMFITRSTREDISSVRDIKGKRFAFASKYSTSGSLAPFFHFYKKEGINSSDLGNYEHLKYHDSVAREVLRGNFDAGVVLDTVFMRYRDKGIRVIGKTEPFPEFLIAARKAAEPEVVNALKNALLELSPDNPEDRAMMEPWDDKIKYGFTGVSDSDYEKIRKMISYLSGRGIMPGVLE